MRARPAGRLLTIHVWSKHFLGYFEEEKVAARAYDDACVELRERGKPVSAG